MPRKSFAIRHVKAAPPDEETARRYLLYWETGDLYHRVEEYPRLTSRALFGNDRPFELEVGCGTGEYICYLAQNEPGTNFVGIDMSLKSLHVAVEGARSLDLSNIRFIRAAAQYTYPLMKPGSVRAVYLHFPDPCLHPKFRKQAIVTREFLDNVYRALADGGELSMMTDQPVLFSRMLGLIEADPRFEKAHEERYLAGADPGRKSRYQVAWEKRGFQPNRILVRKKPLPGGETDPAPSRQPAETNL